MSRGRQKPPQTRQRKAAANAAATTRRQKTDHRQKKGGSTDRVVLSVLLVVIAALLVVLIKLLPGSPPLGERPSSESPSVSTSTEEPREPAADTATPAETPTENEVTEIYPDDESVPQSGASSEGDQYWWLPEAPADGSRPGRIYIVLDDAGNSLDTLDDFLALPMPLTIAVLPQRDHSVETALRVAGAGKEVILHQPMEAVNGANPGEGLVSSDLSDAEVTDELAINLDSVPGAAGLNNHMGSQTTQDPRVMRLVMQEAKRRGLFFLDSRTTSASVASRLAREIGVPFAERNVFLDNVHTRDDILSALGSALAMAYRQDSVVVIGHVTVPLVAELLGEVYPILVERGFTFGLLSDLVQ